MLRKLAALMAAAVFLSAALPVACAVAADAPAPAATTPTDAGNQTKKLEAGLPAIERLLRLMDTDANGKVSRQEFMRFMEAEFDKADVNKDNELDPKELAQLVRSLTHPTRGPGR